jgi:hypothetical protein
MHDKTPVKVIITNSIQMFHKEVIAVSLFLVPNNSPYRPCGRLRIRFVIALLQAMAKSHNCQCSPSPNFGREARGEGKSRTNILATERMENK